jgi:hypothetical protein
VEIPFSNHPHTVIDYFVDAVFGAHCAPDLGGKREAGGEEG